MGMIPVLNCTIKDSAFGQGLFFGGEEKVDMRILHILNGDCALAGWQQGGFAGEVLVWRENYLLGELPETADITGFNRIRADILHRAAPERSEEEIFTELQEMHKTLFTLCSGDRLVLWLDCCSFDQALKKRLLELISLLPEKPEIYLVQEDVVWDSEAFALYRNWEAYFYPAE